MAVDKLVDSSQLNSDLTSVANAIRAKSGGSSQLAFPAGFVSEIGNIPTGGGGADMPTFTVTFASDGETIQSVTCDKTYAECCDYLDDNINGAILNIVVTGGDTSTDMLSNSRYSNGSLTYSLAEWLDVVYTSSSLTATTPSWLAETLNATTNGTYYPTNGAFTEVNVNVPTGTARTSADLTANNLTVTAPAGLYASDATKTLSDQNLIASNIKKDVSIFGVTGTYEAGGGGGVSGTFTPSSNARNITLTNCIGKSNIVVFNITDFSSAPVFQTYALD